LYGRSVATIDEENKWGKLPTVLERQFAGPLRGECEGWRSGFNPQKRRLA